MRPKVAFGLPFGRGRRFLPSVLERFIFSFLNLDETTSMFFVSKALSAQVAMFLDTIRTLRWSSSLFKNWDRAGVIATHTHDLAVIDHHLPPNVFRWQDDLWSIERHSTSWVSFLIKRNAKSLRSVSSFKPAVSKTIVQELLHHCNGSSKLQEFHAREVCLSTTDVDAVIAAFPRLTALSLSTKERWKEKAAIEQQDICRITALSSKWPDMKSLTVKVAADSDESLQGIAVHLTAAVANMAKITSLDLSWAYNSGVPSSAGPCPGYARWNSIVFSPRLPRQLCSRSVARALVPPRG